MASKQLQDLVYAGNVSPADTWDALLDDPDAVLVDVRTPEEWAYVGIVDTAEMGREAVFVPWLLFPRMTLNPDFAVHLQRAVNISEDTPIYFLCRSGHRSAFAAHRMTELGFTKCYNVAEGFEGDPDDEKHRGTKNGWKVAGLPWIQN